MSAVPDPRLLNILRSSAFLDDAQEFARVPADALERIVAAVGAEEGFVSPAALTDAVRGANSGVERPETVASFIRNIVRVRQSLEVDPPTFADRIAVALRASKPARLEQAAVDRLAENLRALPALPALEAQAKAEMLLLSTGQALQDSQVICDLRPVFDETRTRVEGVVPMTTLRIVYTTAVLPQAVEVTLNEEQLESLHKQLEKARSKLAVLRAFLRERNVNVATSSGGDS